MGLQLRASELHRPRSLGDQVEEIIRDSILEGTLAPGERLVESQIAFQLGLSRTPVREAITRLERDGLVTMSLSGAAVVGLLSLDELEDITAVRQVVEPYAVRVATRRISPEGLSELEGLFALMATAVEEGEFYQYISANDRLHAKLCEASGSAALAAVIRALNFALYFRQIAGLFTRGHLRVMLEEHERILDAIRQGDEERTEQLFRQHIGKTLELIQHKKAEQAHAEEVVVGIGEEGSHLEHRAWGGKLQS